MNFYFYKLFKLFLITLFCCTSTTIFAQKIVVEGEKEVSSLGSSLSYFINSEEKGYTVEEISNQNFESKWLKNPSEHLNLGYLSVPVWIKVEISNQSELTDWHLVLDIPFSDSLDFYKKTDDNSFKHIPTGWLLPYDSRGKIKHNGFALPLGLEPNQTTTYYLRIRSDYPILLPISIAPKDIAMQQSQDSHVAYGIYFGILLVMILYNLVIFLLTRDKNYLYYILTIVGTFIIFGGASGYLFKYMYPNTPSINFWIVRAAMSMEIIFTAIFTINFLQLKTHGVWFYRLFLGIITICIPAFILNSIGYDGAVNSVAKIHIFLLLVSSVYCWVKGGKFARFFVLAWLFYLIGGLLTTLRNSGTLPINFWTTHGAEIGSALEVALISIALADRYRIIKKEKDMAIEKALFLEQENSHELERKVNERTKRLHESNEELAQTNEELSVTLEVMDQQKTEIESKRKDITDSINYAKRIQDAILPTQEAIQATFSDSFTLYLPKDVVSGDFYFFMENESDIFLAVADCTGHGVPGSLMAMIGTNLLRESIVEKYMILPSQILMNLHTEIVATLKQTETGNRDGMDISLCVINKSENKIYFSGAKNTLISIKNEEVKEYKGSKFSIGGSVKTEGIIFEDTILEIDNQTSYYMYSDGYQDQFGGKKDKKFMRKNLKELLQKNHRLPFEEQKQILNDTIFDWQKVGKTSQIDDILVMGFRI